MFIWCVDTHQKIIMSFQSAIITESSVPNISKHKPGQMRDFTFIHGTIQHTVTLMVIATYMGAIFQ